MPAYLCHGFRWHRKSIRYFTILQDVDDAAPEWIVAPRSALALLETFYEMYDFLPRQSLPSRNASGEQPKGGLANATKTNLRTSSYDQKSNEYEEERPGKQRDDQAMTSPNAVQQKSMSRLRKADRRDDALPLPLPPPPPVEPEIDLDAPFNAWSSLKLLEEFDPSNESMVSGPWAYIADYAVRIDTSISPIGEMLYYEERMKADKVKAMSGPSEETNRKTQTSGSEKAGWFEKLRDNLQRGEDIRWYVVMCGDEERTVPEGDDYDEEEDDESATQNTDQEQLGNEDSAPGFIEDEFEFRLPEFANSEMRPLEVQPLRLQKTVIEQKPPAPRIQPPTVTDKPVAPRMQPQNVTDKPVAPRTQPQNVTDKPISPRIQTQNVTNKPVAPRLQPQTVERKPIESRTRPQVGGRKPPDLRTQPEVFGGKLPVTRMQLPPAPRPTRTRIQFAEEKPPAVPAKDPPYYLPPPHPLQNLHDVGMMSMELTMRPKTQRSTNGIRKFFSRKNIESAG
ncbi:hypothetical protein BJ170DRAFT_257905 [Xylariales sp. AK1849]|nr:hypothetical protein BJ170DRAFT_257905 [Xylariales sp. AK1849]